MTIHNIKRKLGEAGIWYSCLSENGDINVKSVTTIPHPCADMHETLFILTTGNIREAEQSISNWNDLINVMIDSECIKYLRKLPAPNLLIVGKNDIGKAIGVLNEAMR